MPANNPATACTPQMVLATLCLVARSDSSITTAVVAEGILSVVSAGVGAFSIPPLKYMWWFASVIFTVIVIVHLVQRIPEGSHDVHKHLTYVTIAAVAIYGVVWLLGSEGTAALGLSQEVAARIPRVALHCTARVRRRPFHLLPPHRQLHPHVPTLFGHTSPIFLLGLSATSSDSLLPHLPTLSPFATPPDTPAFGNHWSVGLLVLHLVAWRRIGCVHVLDVAG